MKKWLLCCFFLLMATPTWAQAIRLSWGHASPLELGFEIERGLALAGPFTVIGTVGENILTYEDRTLATPTTFYCYRVRAFNLAYATDPNSKQYSAYSSVACGAAQTPPPPFPTDLRLSQVQAALSRVQDRITAGQRMGKIGADLDQSQRTLADIRAALRPPAVVLESE